MNQEDRVINAAAGMIAKHLQETELTIALKTLEKAELLVEFIQFHKDPSIYILDAIIEFAKLHPDKLYVPEETQSYSQVIKIP